MALSLKQIIKKANLLAKSTSILKVLASLKGKLMAFYRLEKVKWPSLMVLNTKVIGKMIDPTVMEFIDLSMVPYMKDSSCLDLNQGKENIFSQMDRHTKGNF